MSGAAPRDVDIAGILIDANAPGLKKIGRPRLFFVEEGLDDRPYDCTLSVGSLPPSL
jgi:hypothetical protein